MCLTQSVFLLCICHLLYPFQTYQERLEDPGGSDGASVEDRRDRVRTNETDNFTKKIDHKSVFLRKSMSFRCQKPCETPCERRSQLIET
jgi:hypothetical protein